MNEVMTWGDYFAMKALLAVPACALLVLFGVGAMLQKPQCLKCGRDKQKGSCVFCDQT